MPSPAEVNSQADSEADLLEYVIGDQELQAANDALRDKSAAATMAWVFGRFDPELVILDCSGGRDSAVGPHVAAHLELASVDVGFGDTGFWPPETYEQIGRLRQLFSGLQFHVSRPTDEVITRMRVERPFAPDERGLVDSDGFLDAVKHRPMTQLHLRLGKFVSISAIHHDQTSYRQGLRDPIVRTRKGGLRVFPFLKWTQEDFDNYIDGHGLPRNELPLLYNSDPEIFHRQLVYHAESGDLDILPIDECGLHTADGKTRLQPAQQPTVDETHGFTAA